MQANQEYKDAIHQASNSTTINNNTFKCLLENSFSVLAGGPEIHNINTLSSSKVDVVKQVYAALLLLCSAFVRQQLSKDDVRNTLLSSKYFQQSRAELFADMYSKHKHGVEISLLNIGNHLPHIIDIKWKIDYIVKSSIIDQSDEPIFRVSLITEAFNKQLGTKQLKDVNFVCDRQELQDLVYKLREASRYCSKLTMDA